ncbi:oligosaccharide flippase family protein [Enterobacter hormaechei]|nr:oligosaccharide flippase family protein [Enterobacter hormaechei]
MKRFYNMEFLKNFIGLSSINVLGMLIPIITMPFLSRVLGADGYGIVLLFSSLSIFMLVIIDYSTNITGVRDAAGNINDIAELSRIYSKYQRLRLILTLLYIPLALLYCHIYFHNMSLMFCLEVIFVSALGYYLTSPWFHQGTSTLSFFSFSTVSVRIIQVLLMFSLVKDSNDLETVIRLNAYAFLITGVTLYIFRKQRMGIIRVKERTPLINDFKEGFDAFLGEFSPNLYSNIPPLIIGAIVSPVIFACYSIALRIINISGSFQSIAAKSLYPLVVKGTSTMRVLLLINLILSAIPFLAIMFFGNEIIHLLLGSGYELAHAYLIICAPALILYSIICSFSYGFFLPKRLDSYFKKTSLFSSIIPAIIGYPLMHQYQVYGALIMLLIARGLFVIMFVYYYLKVKNN